MTTHYVCADNGQGKGPRRIFGGSSRQPAVRGMNVLAVYGADPPIVVISSASLAVSKALHLF
jgi:hypothetical protein